ncbi:class I SAM-dependent methyltransferase [Polynucleobacter paneuropaeus]|nr:class I SAM-dependent methyltransferase [Polynucleobacter paneuropaeus]
MGCINKHSGDAKWSQNDAEVIDCIQCGYAHVLPLPSAEDLQRFYAEEFYSDEIPYYIDSNIADQKWWEIVFKSRLNVFEKMLPSRLGKSVIDVGSGPGFFLKFAIEDGWKALGVEPSKVAVEHTKSLGANAIEGFFDQKMVDQLEPVSAIHASEVLEHVPNPGEILDLFHQVLLPEGVICICVPNDFNDFQDALTKFEGYPSWWVSTHHHLNYFNHKSLSSLIQKHRFKIEKITSTFPIDLFLMMGDNYIGNDELGKICHQKRMNFELLLHKAGLDSLRDELYQKFSECGLGREVLIYARKI